MIHRNANSPRFKHPKIKDRNRIATLFELQLTNIVDTVGAPTGFLLSRVTTQVQIPAATPIYFVDVSGF